jgi:hypothetical protein
MAVFWKEEHMKVKSIPVMVDDCKDEDEFKITRAAYFYIEAIEPIPDIPLVDKNLKIPILPLEFSGVLHSPGKGFEYFETPELIEELFLAVESNKSLYIDSDNIWIPNSLFNKHPGRGDIFRISLEYFIQQYSICRDDATLDSGITQINERSGLVIYSENETIAFEKWANEIISDVKAAYPKSEELKLSWSEK